MIKPRFTWGLLSAAMLMGVYSCGSDKAANNSGDAGTGTTTHHGGSSGSSGHTSTSGRGGNSGTGTGTTDGGGNAPGTDDGGTPDGGGAMGDGAPPVSAGCPALEDRTVVTVDPEISGDTSWTCDNLYILTDLTYVIDDSVLTIEAGTEIEGDPGSALVITRGSQLETVGTALDPVVFTSSAAVGSRIAGDWGGVVLLGSAKINVTGGENQIEGIDPTLSRGAYGALTDASSCGSLAYTRVEFAGFELSLDNELNGITLGGCGSGTTLSYVQVHMGLDDGIEQFGGLSKLDHIVISSADDDGLDWDQGYSGSVQFAVIQQNPAVTGSPDPNGMEGDNNRDANDALPRSMPSFSNITVIGANYSAGFGAVLRRGTWGTIQNTIFMNTAEAIDVRDGRTAAGTTEDPIALSVDHSLFFQNGVGGTNQFQDEATDPTTMDDDNGFDEEAFFSDAAQVNKFDEDPLLGDPTNVTAPDFVPAANSPAKTGAATPGAGFDATAKYMGAFKPGGEDWTAGWTAYPEN